jgi:glutathione S-transferase
MMQVYGFPNTRSTRATWALEEAGAEYGYTLINLMQGEHRRPDYLKINPGGKVPALIDGDLILTESAAICTYIGEKFPASGLVPPLSQPTERAHYFQWCFFVMSELETPLWSMAKHSRLLPEEYRVPAVANTCLWEFQRAAKVLEQHMKDREYAVGGQFTAADILLGGTLNWAIKQAIALDSPTLQAYAERLANRPALLRAREREAQAATIPPA